MKHHKVFRQIDIRCALDLAPPEIKNVYEHWYYRNGDGLFMKVTVKNNGGKTHFFYAVSADYFHFIDNLRNKKVLGEDAKILNHESVQPYLKSFANGFIEGYHNYDSEIQDSTAIFGKDRDLIAKRVFGQIQKIPHALGSRTSFKGSTAGGLPVVITKQVFFDGGIKTGKLYKAWYFIINNPSLFSPLFRDKYYFWYKGFREYLTVDENIDYRIDLDDLIEEIEKQVPGQPSKQKPESKQPQPATEQDKPKQDRTSY